MLPENYHEDDEKWILAQMRRIPIELCEKAAKGYDAALKEAYEAEPIPRLKEGEARRIANTRLREYVSKVAVRW